MAKRFSSHSIVLIGTALLIAVVMQVPQLLHTRDPRFQGILVHLNSDEDVYFAHVQEALSGRPEQSSEAIVGDPAVIGTHMGFFERIEGALFSFTGWRAAEVEQFMDSVVPPLFFLTLVLFFTLCGTSQWAAYAGALAFVLIEFYSLSRPVQPRDSFLVLFLGFSGIIAGLKPFDAAQGKWKWVWGILGGAVLGVLVGAYFWAWTFAALWLGLVFLWEAAEWLRKRSQEKLRRIGLVMMFGAAAVIAAIPALLSWGKILRHPLYDDASFRSGLYHSRTLESLPYSILFTLMAGGILFELCRRYSMLRPYRYLIVTVVTAFLVIHQQLIHGVVFNYVSHYLFALVVAAICVVLIWHGSLVAGRRPTLVLSGIAALIYLAAIAYDGRYVLNQFTVTAGRFDEQHFASLLPVLDDLPRATILSDPTSSLFIASSTRHDVVYTLYLKNLVMSHEEISERFCTTVLPIPLKNRHLEGQALIWPDANSAFPSALRSSDEAKSVWAREIALVEAACKIVDGNPSAALKTFHVQYVLWDEKRMPEWNLKRLGVPLTKMAAGEGWSLWRI